MTSKNYHKILIDIYTKYQPDKLKDINALLVKYKGKEDELVKNILCKYDTIIKSGTDNKVADDKKDYYNQLTELFLKHNPDKIKDIDTLLLKYSGKEDDLLQKISAKYTSTGKRIIKEVNDLWAVQPVDKHEQKSITFSELQVTPAHSDIFPDAKKSFWKYFAIWASIIAILATSVIVVYRSKKSTSADAASSATVVDKDSNETPDNGFLTNANNYISKDIPAQEREKIIQILTDYYKILEASECIKLKGLFNTNVAPFYSKKNATPSEIVNECIRYHNIWQYQQHQINYSTISITQLNNDNYFVTYNLTSQLKQKFEDDWKVFDLKVNAQLTPQIKIKSMQEFHIKQYTINDSSSPEMQQQWDFFWIEFKEAFKKKDKEKINMLTKYFSTNGGDATLYQWLDADAFLNNENFIFYTDLLNKGVKDFNYAGYWKATGKSEDGDLYFQYKNGNWFFSGIIGD